MWPIKALICLISICFQLNAANFVSYSGSVSLNDGTTKLPGIIVAFDPETGDAKSCTTDVSGNYVISIDTGTYRNLRLRNLGVRMAGVPYTVEYTVKQNLRVTDGTIEDLKMKKFFELHGTVLSSNGDTIKGAFIESGRDLGYGPPKDWDSSGISDGSYSILTDSGTFRITVRPPMGSSYKETHFDIDIKKDTLLNLVLPKVITISGAVTNFEGDTLRGIGVTFEKTGWQLDTATNDSGKYSIQLGIGTYSIRIRNGMMRNANKAPAHLEQTVFSNILFDKDSILDIKLPYYPIVRCSVVTRNGQPIKNVVVKSSEGPMPEVPLSDLDTTDENGICYLRVKNAVKNNFWIIPPQSSGYTEERDTVQTSKDSTLVIKLSEAVTLSGTIFFSDSTTPVSGIAIAIEYGSEQKMVYTNANGAYTITLQSGTYRLRLRNPGPSNVATGVPRNLEYTVLEQMNLIDSKILNVKLPLFPTISGIVKNVSGQPVSGVQLRFARWNGGSEAPPYCESTTDVNGAYSIIIGAGVNKVRLTAPQGTQYGSFDFVELFDSSRTKDIFLADQAHGITRVLPSVITRGESGRIMINGLNANLNSVNSAANISFGDGITIDSIKTVSSITMYAYISIDSNATIGGRDLIVHAGATTSVGSNLLTVTAPATARFELNELGKTTKEIVIADGTGTELTIPAGTPVILPAGADSIISYQAPFVKDQSTSPSTGEFTSVQRTLEPHGIVFGDTVVMTCQYKKEDVEGINELTLNPFYFSDSANGKGTIGSAITVIKRDTAANTVSMILPHFSMFRLAANAPIKTVKNYIRKNTTSAQIVSHSGNCKIVFNIGNDDAKNTIKFELYTITGKLVKSFVYGQPGVGTHTILLNRNVDSHYLMSTGSYILNIEIGEKLFTEKVFIAK